MCCVLNSYNKQLRLVWLSKVRLNEWIVQRVLPVCFRTEGKETFREEGDIRWSPAYAPFFPLYTYDTTTLHLKTRVEKLSSRLPILMPVLQLFSRGSLMLIALSNSKYRRGQNGRNASCEICRVFLCVI